MNTRPYARHCDYQAALAKWRTGRFPSKAALARHLGMERGGMARLLRIAELECVSETLQKQTKGER